MKIAIIGIDGLGALLGLKLTKAEHEAWLLDDNPEKTKKIANGIKLEGADKSHKIKIKTTADIRDIGRPEAVFVCAKSHETENILKKFKDLITNSNYIISLQNGLGNLQLINEYVDTARMIAGITSEEAEFASEGSLRYTNKGQTVIGHLNKRLSGITREISSTLNKADFPTKASKDINSIIWSNIIINAGIYAISAITRLKNGSLVKNEYTREIMRRAVSEAVKVAKRKRIKLSYDDAIQKVEAVCRAKSDNISSMLQDVLDKRKTEIDFINGAIARQAKGLNIKTPTNDMLTELVKTIESNYENAV